MRTCVKKTVYQMEMDAYERAINEDLKVKKINNNEFIVHNNDHNSTYNVSLSKNGMICTCPHFFYRNVLCKHIVAVENSLRNHAI